MDSSTVPTGIRLSGSLVNRTAWHWVYYHQHVRIVMPVGVHVYVLVSGERAVDRRL